MKKIFFEHLKHNWKSGITVGLVSIPIAASLAVASNTTPIAGIITAFWAGLIASLFGGSNYNIIGPTGALSGLLFMYVQIYGTYCLPMLALISGVFILIGYFFKIDKYLAFIPGSALHGFILGIACMIILNQIAPALGITAKIDDLNVVVKAYKTLQYLDHIYWPSCILFCFVFVGLLLFARFSRRLPGTIILTPISIFLGYLGTNQILPFYFETLGSRYNNMVPTIFISPYYHFKFLYIAPALSIAVISILETLISAKIADGITKTKHNRNKEMLGLSLANIVSGLAGGIPATAALARTALNIHTHCTHKTSAMISSLCIAFISLLLFGYFTYLPLASVAAILVFVSFRMLETEHFFRMFKVDKKSFIISLIVAFVTMYEDAIVGVLLGAIIVMIIFMEKLSRGYHEIMLKKEKPLSSIENISEIQENTFVYAIKGPLAYINAQSHIARLEETPSSYTHVILDFHDVHFVDIDGVEAFGEMVSLLEQKGHIVYIAELNPVIEHFLRESYVFEILTRTHRIFKHVYDVFPHI